jgi:glyoxylase-like metal-dependent hydrolase (beta-lactamase superfamily II)
MAEAAELEARGIHVIPTPGHAPHHVSFVMGNVLFAGEAIGTRVDLPSGSPYLRPATPPRFILEVALESLERLLSLEPEPEWTAFAHYGLVRDARIWCRRARKQLPIWVEVVRQLAEESRDGLEERLFARLQEIDPLYGRGRFEELAPDIAAREREFLGNTLSGMLGYIDDQTG